jgi:hypothetical protein
MSVEKHLLILYNRIVFIFFGENMKKTILLISCLLLIGCSPVNTYCPEEEAKYGIDTFLDIGERWDDAINLAFSTSRIALADQISNLQDIKRETNNLELPECLHASRSYYVMGMEDSIEGFILFMTEGSEAEISRKFDSADTNFLGASIYLAEIESCLPDCEDPTKKSE